VIRVLLDENLPRKLKWSLDAEALTVPEVGWSGIRNRPEVVLTVTKSFAHAAHLRVLRHRHLHLLPGRPRASHAALPRRVCWRGSGRQYSRRRGARRFDSPEEGEVGQGMGCTEGEGIATGVGRRR